MIKKSKEEQCLKINSVESLLDLMQEFALKRGSRPRAIFTNQENVEVLQKWFEAMFNFGSKGPPDFSFMLSELSLQGVPIIACEDVMWL